MSATDGWALRGWLARHRGAVAAALALLVATGILATAGGFAETSRVGGTLPVGEPVGLGRFVVTVERAEMVNTSADGTPFDPSKPARVRVWLTVDNVGRKSVPLALFDSVTLLPGPPTADASVRVGEEGRTFASSNLDPDLPRRISLERDWGGSQSGPAPEAVVVVLHKDVPPGPNLLLAASGPVTGPAVGAVRVPVLDRRTAGAR